MIFSTHESVNKTVNEMRPRPMSAIIGKLKYDTEKSTLIADDAYFDGKNYERDNTNTFLYKTPKGRFFYHFINGDNPNAEPTHIQPLSLEEAITTYHDLKVKHVKFEEAFPGVEIEDA